MLKRWISKIGNTLSNLAHLNVVKTPASLVNISGAKIKSTTDQVIDRMLNLNGLG
ncbi:MAG: hypothetical protein HOH33_06485 [Verrucomicrobia bacterium]|nr:hypothetical protein [Verrucomicrobiota bacterium]